MASRNPVLSEKTFERFSESIPASSTMTMDGTTNKAILLLAVIVGTALASMVAYLAAGESFLFLALGGSLLGFILSMVICFKPESAPYLAVPYSMCEGVFLGVISLLVGSGAALQAVFATMGLAFLMLAIFRLRLIRVTERFRIGMTCALLSLLGVYVVTALFHLVGIPVPFIHSTGFAGILISLAVIGLASLCLLLDFDQIEHGVRHHAPKYMEWYCAFSLMVTLVWIYLEVLRLLGSRK